MGYKNLIDMNVKKAFVLLKDLAEPLVLSKKSDTSFNFKTLTATQTTSDVTTKAVITDSNKKSDVLNAMTKLAILKTKEIGDISYYDKIFYKNESWSISSVITSNNFITYIEMQKGV
jgi:hypothetical protein